MNSLPASVRDDCGPDRVDQAVRLLDDERRRYGTVKIERVWARCRNMSSNGTESADLLADLVKADLRRRFDLGESPQVADYLVRVPDLRKADDRMVSLIYEEYCLREEQGTPPDLAAFCDRYADWKDSLFSQLQCHKLFSPATETIAKPPQFPRPGEDFEEFHLVSLLGEGGASRVFVARDQSLGGKPVVLKVAIDRGEEPKLQGRLNHPHIVPVNSVAFAPERGLVGLSMPLQPGLPLDLIITRIDPSSRPTHARAIWQVLVDGAAQGLIPDGSGEFRALLRSEISRVGPRGDHWSGFPIREGYAQGVAWIVMTLARALHYAHSMDTFHRDVKPGNILLTLAQGPQLLDFNLAESPHSAERAHEAVRGGTLPYMAPEQVQAFLNPDRWGSVSAAADVYSLGLVLREFLTGEAPVAPPGNLDPPVAMAEILVRRRALDVSVRRLNPTIPHALEAIVARALAFDPANRYPDAESLAVDLESFLKRKPLVLASNASRREKLVNWTVRHRWPVVAAVALVMMLGIALYRPIVERLNPRLETLEAFQTAVDGVERGENASALVSLLKLEEVYPRSCLVKFYLTIVLDSEERPFEAESRFRAALGLSDVETALLPWVSRHPDLALRLEKFTADRYDLAYLDDEDETTAKARIPFSRMADQALKVAESINPGSHKIQRRLARVETLLQEYPTALARLTRSIEEIESDASGGNELVDLYYLRLMRAWSTSAYVDDAQDKRLMDPESAVRMLTTAQADLDFCSRFMDNWAFDNKPLKEYYLMRTSLRVAFSQSEVELSRHHLAEAEQRLNHARSILNRFTERARVLDLPRSGTVKMSRRLDDDLNRVRALGLARFPTPAKSPDPEPNRLSRSG